MPCDSDEFPYSSTERSTRTPHTNHMAGGSHDILVSGTASGELHFWDGPTGTFVFGTLARHPHGGGLSAMGSSEGISTAVVDIRAVIGGSSNGSGGSNGVVPATDAPKATPAAPPIATVTVALEDSANLMLYTACDGGFVKTWRVGEQKEGGGRGGGSCIGHSASQGPERGWDYYIVNEN